MAPVTTERPATAIDHEYIAAFVVTMPADPERDRRADEFRDRAARLAEIRRRPAEIRGRLAELVQESADATASQRKGPGGRADPARSRAHAAAR